MPYPAHAVRLRILFSGQLEAGKGDGKADNYCPPNLHPAILTPSCLCSLAKPLQPDNAISYFLRATEEGNFLSCPRSISAFDQKPSHIFYSPIRPKLRTWRNHINKYLASWQIAISTLRTRLQKITQSTVSFHLRDRPRATRILQHHRTHQMSQHPSHLRNSV